MANYQALRDHHIACVEAMLPSHLGRLEWPADLVRAERRRALRALVAAAVRGSRWHRERLAKFDTARITEADLDALPVMTKTDLMERFDEIVTDTRLTREICERHLDGLDDDAYLSGEYHVVASDGLSGQRGVYVYGWNAWATCWVSMIRSPERDWASDPTLAGVSRVAAVDSETNVEIEATRIFLEVCDERVSRWISPGLARQGHSGQVRERTVGVQPQPLVARSPASAQSIAALENRGSEAACDGRGVGVCVLGDVRERF
jgi:hypothetical protein